MKLIYLASPYSHPSAAVREWRYQCNLRAAAMMMKEGYAVFSPIAHSHPIEKFLAPINPDAMHDFWLAQDTEILKRCKEMFVLCIDGWQQSEGIKKEIVVAQEHGIPVFHKDPIFIL